MKALQHRSHLDFGQLVRVPGRVENEALVIMPVDGALWSLTRRRVCTSGSADGLDSTVTPSEITIKDNDDESTGIELTVTEMDVAEGGGAMDLTVMATLTGGGIRQLQTWVRLWVDSLTAIKGEGEDFTASWSQSNFLIPAGSRYSEIKNCDRKTP